MYYVSNYKGRLDGGASQYTVAQFDQPTKPSFWESIKSLFK